MSNVDLTFYNTLRYRVISCLSMSVFFYLFLIVFLPFGVDNYNPSHEYTLTFLLEIFYLFLAILLSLLINEILLRPLIVKKVSLTNITLWSLWTFLLIGSVVFITYNILGNWHDFYFRSYLGFLVNCSSILIFPLLGTFFFFRYQSLQRHYDHFLKSKSEAPTMDQMITFRGQGSKDQITLSISIFMYGRAHDNYVELYYLEHKKLAKFLIRASLANLVSSINSPAITRCHRSYMVNLLQVEAVKGSRSQINLSLSKSDVVVPVSKSYRESVMKQLKALKDFE